MTEWTWSVSEWANATQLELTFIDTFNPVNLFAMLPLIKSVTITCLVYSSDYSAGQKDNSQLKDFEIGQLKGEKWTMDNAAGFISIFARQHPNFSKLALPGDFKERVKGML